MTNAGAWDSGLGARRTPDTAEPRVPRPESRQLPLRQHRFAFARFHRLGERLTSPLAHVPKTYHARVRGIPDADALAALREGTTLDDGVTTRPAQVRLLGAARGADVPSSWLEIVLTEGRNRQVRRMGAAVGHEVLELVRVAIGRFGLGSLAPGEWRELSEAEVADLSR